MHNTHVNPYIWFICLHVSSAHMPVLGLDDYVSHTSQII